MLKEIYNYSNDRIVFFIEAGSTCFNFVFPKIIIYRCCERHIRIEGEVGLFRKGIAFYFSYTLKKYR